MLLILGSFFIGCTSDKENSKGPFEPIALNDNGTPIIQIVRHSGDTRSVDITRQITQALQYTKIDYSITDLNILNPRLQIYPDIRTLVLTTSSLSQADSVLGRKLTRFVAQGNNLFIAAPIRDTRLSFLKGFKPGVSPQLSDTAKGIKDVSGIFPGYEGNTFYKASLAPHNGFEGNAFKNEVDVLARAPNDSTYPVILRHKIGDGHVVFFNSQRAQDKQYRGLFFSTLLRGLEGVPYSVVNGGTIFLDDFPVPLYDEVLPPIDEEYGVPHAQFVANIWWPDMKELADSLNITYTAIPAFNFNANVVPPFDFNEWEMGRIERNSSLVKGSTWLARDVKQGAHELGFHGYNHFSLTDEEWPTQEFMISSLQSVRKRWLTDRLGSLPVSYVPPSNIIDSTGIQALSKGMSSIRYMSSLYLGDVQRGAGREFAPDPFNPRLFDYPRMTSGYVFNDNKWFQQNSLYLLTGIWNHFIHPDDVFQLQDSEKIPYRKRNPLNLGWKSDETYEFGLYQGFNSWLDTTKKYYPFINLQKAKKIVPKVIDWRHRNINYRYEEGILKVSNRGVKNQTQSEPGIDYFMYVSKDMEARYQPLIENQSSRMTKVPLWDGYLYQFKSARDTMLFPDIGSGYLVTDSKKSASINSAIAEYESFQNREEQVVDSRQGEEGEQWRDTRLDSMLSELNRNPDSRRIQNRVISLSEEFDRISVAIKVLVNRVVRDSVWQEEDLNRLVKYYGWQDAVERAWGFADMLWKTAPDPFAVKMYDKTVSAFGSPQDPERAYRWFQRKLRAEAENPDSLIRTYVNRNQGFKNWNKTRPLLLKLLERNPESDTLYNYTFQRSLWYDSADSTLALLDYQNKKSQNKQPGDSKVADSLLMKYVNQYQGADYWDTTRPILLELIERKPKTDSLCHYTLQRSLWYDSPDSTMVLLEKFSSQSYEQLQPLADEIAGFYAYQQQNYTKALWWAEQTDEINDATNLDWIAQQNRYAAYLSYIENDVSKSPPDSLQIQIINQLSYSGYTDKLIEWLNSRYSSIKQMSAGIREIFLNRFKELSSGRREELVRLYSNFFGEQIVNDIRIRNRMEQGEYLSSYGRYATDNFDNTSYRAGLRHVWRRDSLTTHEVNLERIGIGSIVNSVNFNDEFYQLIYRRHWNRPETSWRVVYEAGLGMASGFAHSIFAIEASYLTPRYTQARFAYEPIWSNAAVARNFSKVTGSVYREEPFGESPLRLTGNLTGNYYLKDWQLSIRSNDNLFSYNQNLANPDSGIVDQNVFHMEGTARLYYELWDRKSYTIENILETTYGDATKIITSGVPYWTPDQLWIGGAGMGYDFNTRYLKYREAQFQGNFMVKYDNQSGFYLSAELQADWLFHPYWNLSLETNASSSSTYRYNNFMLSLRYTFKDWDFL